MATDESPLCCEQHVRFSRECRGVNGVDFQWEEFSSDVEGVNVKRPDESKITRDELAVLVATHIWQVIRDVKTKKRVRRFFITLQSIFGTLNRSF